MGVSGETVVAAVPGAVVVEAGADGLVLAVRGRLDAQCGELLQEALEAAIVSADPDRPIAVDLRGVAGSTAEGVRAVAACTGLGARHRGGLHFLAGRVSAG